MIRVLHFADLHLGVENYGSLDPATGLSSRVADFLRALDRLLEYAASEQVDLVLFAGDAFKTRSPSPTYQRELAKRIRSLAVGSGIPMFLLVGNHDLPRAAGRAHSLEIFDTLDVQNVTVARKPGVFRIETRSGPLQVVALPWILRSSVLVRDEYRGMSLEEIDAQMGLKLEEVFLTGDESLASQLNPVIPTILAAHGTVQGAVYGSERSVMLGNDLKLTGSLIQNPLFDYVALGHIHKHQVVGHNPPAVYAGSLERVDFGEEKDQKGFVLVELSRGQAEFQFVPLEARRFVTIEVEASSPDPTAQVLAAIDNHDIEDAVVRVLIEMDAETEPLLDERTIRAALGPAFYIAAVAKQVRRRQRQRLDRESIETLTERQLLGVYLQAKGVSPDRINLLLRHADQILLETTPSGGQA